MLVSSTPQGLLQLGQLQVQLRRQLLPLLVLVMSSQTARMCTVRCRCLLAVGMTNCMTSGRV